MEITTIGLDMAKSVFQLHAVDAEGTVVWRKKVRRGALLETLAQVPACLIGMEACATAHYWAREISALGHEVRLMPPAYVKAYLRRQKNDAADAEAIDRGLEQIAAEYADTGVAEDPALEDIHMHVEARLSEIIGPAAGRLHTARSRNDQVATDFRLWVRDAIDELSLSLVRLEHRRHRLEDLFRAESAEAATEPEAGLSA